MFNSMGLNWFNQKRRQIEKGRRPRAKTWVGRGAEAHPGRPKSSQRSREKTNRVSCHGSQ